MKGKIVKDKMYKRKKDDKDKLEMSKNKRIKWDWRNTWIERDTDSGMTRKTAKKENYWC